MSLEAPPLKFKRRRAAPKVKESELQWAMVQRLIAERLVIFVDPWRAKHPPGMKRTAASERLLERNRARLIEMAHEQAQRHWERTQRPIAIVHRSNTGARMLPGHGKEDGQFVKWGTPGLGDVSGIIYPTGQVIEMEVKRPGEEPNEIQKAWGAMTKAAGGVWFWADSLEGALAGFRRALQAPDTPR